jgi:hypothetical protein
MDTVLKGSDTPKEVSDCALAAHVDPADCTWGPSNAPKTAVLIGDSTAVAYVPALQDVIAGTNGQWKLVHLAVFGCEFADITIPHSESVDKICPGRKSDALSTIASMRPDLVIVTHAYTAPKDSSGETLSPEEWTRHLSGYVGQFRGDAAQVVLLAPAPQGKDLKACYTRVSSPSDCMSPLNKQWKAMAEAEQHLAPSLNGLWVDSQSWYCTPKGECPPFVETVAQKFDGLHITVAYAHRIAAHMAAALQPVMS